MPRNRILRLATLFALIVVTTPASAQDARVRRTPRAYVVLSDGLGISGGGALGRSSGLLQYFRLGAVVALRDHHGVEVSAIRVQELIPARGLFNDPANTPRADGLILSYASLSRRREGGFPSIVSIGGGVVRRPTTDPARKRDTGALQLGVEGNLVSLPRDWADLTAGARLIVMPGADQRQTYAIAIAFGIRLG